MSDKVEVAVAGHGKRLFYGPGTSRCGEIRDGVAFWFEGEGCWVVSLETLRGIVVEEDKRRAELAVEVPGG